eukprot:7851912-Pyramimonas_sp.AAC.1
MSVCDHVAGIVAPGCKMALKSASRLDRRACPPALSISALMPLVSGAFLFLSCRSASRSSLSAIGGMHSAPGASRSEWACLPFASSR